MTAILAPRSTPHPDLSGFDAVAEAESVVEFLRATFAAAGARHRAIVSLSGGIDSAVVAAAAVAALGCGRVTLVRQPYGLVGPARHPASTRDSLDDAQAVIDALDPTGRLLDVRTINVARATDALVDSVGLRVPRVTGRAPTAAERHALLCLGNMKARMRAVTARYFANLLGGLVIGTENRTEHELGYFTIGGDEETDLEPIAPYLKCQVRALARALGVPDSILAKAPSADLWVGQTDEGELGFSYAAADLVLDTRVRLAAADGTVDVAAIAERTGLAPAVVSAVLAHRSATAFKRAGRPTHTRPDLAPVA